MASSTSLVRRVALGAACAASAAAFLSAFATVGLAASLLGRAEDRRLVEAAFTLGTELDHDAHEDDGVFRVHRDESEEMRHTGMTFAIYDSAGSIIVGDPRVGLPKPDVCASFDTFRTCRVRTKAGLQAVAGAARTTLFPALTGAAVIAALLAATLAWFASRPVSRFAVGPLSRLREQIARLDADALGHADLGEPENVAEVDALRSTIAHLVSRLERALAQAQRFAANAAHELRTPLTSVRAELELLSETLGDESAKDDAVRAQRKLEELSVLIERLLILSLPTRSHAETQEAISLRDVLEDVVRDLPEEERARVEVSEEDAVVRGDATLLATMIANAISNGLKFGNRVRTSVEPFPGCVVVCIDDDGPGIDTADRGRVFEPFFRADDTLRRRIPGHGLGLPLIRHIAQTHGGNAEFVDMPGTGARLKISIPV